MTPRVQAWNAANVARRTENDRQWRLRNPEKAKAINERYNSTHHTEILHRTRDWSFRKKYGITVAQYDAMFAAQGGLCAICHQPERRKKGGRVCRLAVDHDHVTKRVRGLLCDCCNRGLGLLGDSAERVASAAQYLARAT